MSSVMDGVDQRTQLAGHNRLELLLFRLGVRQRFGINVFKIREVIKCPPLTRMPHSHPVTRGIAHMRGKTITVFDLGAAVGKRPQAVSEDASLLITEFNRQVQGFLVSGVDRIVNVNWEDIKPPPSGMGDDNYMTAVTSVDGELVEVIDVERVLGDVVNIDTDVSDGLTQAGASSHQDGRKILVVDDSLVARKQILGVLKQLDLEYLEARNGREALDLLLQMNKEDGGPISDRIAFVLSDVEMPEMDGYTLTKTIKENPQLQVLQVCLHTSLSGVFNHAMAEKVGADRLIEKFDPDELAKDIIEMLGFGG